jgi:hypothetical protein
MFLINFYYFWILFLNKIEFSIPFITYCMETAPCPICKKDLFYNPRYPNEVCKSCVGRATDGHGRYVRFYNRAISSGYIAFYADADGREEYLSHICYISKQKCEAKEARFGGIVVELIKENTPHTEKPPDSEENN